MTDFERRFTAYRVEVRGGEKRTIGGYAAVFNKLSEDLGGFVERIDPKAFNQSRGMNFPNVLARYNHSDDFLLGTTSARTLRIGVDEEGLTYEVDVPQSRADVYELVERGDVAKSSFAFRSLEDDWTVTESGYPMRTLLNNQLVDVAPVNIPAYPDATVGLRSLAAKFDADPDEVRELAKKHELRRLFPTSEGGAPVQKHSSAAALARVRVAQIDLGL